jgi:GNAT superfamily N-acetyltransferase
MSPFLRRARPEEAAFLPALTLRSKAHWGYDAEFMAGAARKLVLSAEAIARDEVWVLETPDGTVLGYYRVLRAEPPVLEDLWVEPHRIGTGLGRILWNHAVEVARSTGSSFMDLVADPNAVGFYERMGAVHSGEIASTIRSGRMLPRMRFRLDSGGV